MNKYKPDWKGFDRGREGVLRDPLWNGVLKILGRHEGEDYYDASSPVYAELETAYPDETWFSDAEDRQFFRAYSAVWTLTGVLERRTAENPGIKLTSLGRAVIAGTVSREAAFLRAAASLEENSSNGLEYPFRILCEAFLKLGSQPVNLEDIYFGIECSWRPSDGDVSSSIKVAKRGAMEATPRRRLRAMLKVLTDLGVISQLDDTWRLASSELANAIVSANAVDEQALLAAPVESAVKEPAPISEAEQVAIQQGVFGETIPEQTRRRIVASIVVRRGQPQFRTKLLALYGLKCAVTSYDAPESLEAAHIVAVSSNGAHSAQNGILLRADIHTLFDLNLLGIDPANFTVVVGPTLSNSLYAKYHGQKVRLPIGLIDRPSTINLQQHLALLE